MSLYEGPKMTNQYADADIDKMLQSLTNFANSEITKTNYNQGFATINNPPSQPPK